MEIRLKPYQDKFIFTHARFPAMVSSIGTGKTMCGIMRMMRLMEDTANNLGIVIRKEFTDLRDSTIKDFERYTGLKVGSNKDVVLPNRSLIMFRHGDEIDVLKNINAGAILIEQGEEFETDETFLFLRDRLRRQTTNERSLFVIANTNGHNWIYKTWKCGDDKEFELYEATTFDNADNLPDDYIADLKKMEQTHPAHYRRYVLNSWEDTDATDKIIQHEWVQNCLGIDIPMNGFRRRIGSMDVARFGDDKTIFYCIENNRESDRLELTHKNTMEVVGYAVQFSKKNGIQDWAIDELNMGSGVIDRMKELGYNVIDINFAKGNEYNENAKNLRAEVYSYAADCFRERKASIKRDNLELQEQLTWAWYGSVKSDGRFIVAPKEEIKKVYKKSPDHADAFCQGLWALQKITRQAEYKERQKDIARDIKPVRTFRV